MRSEPDAVEAVLEKALHVAVAAGNVDAILAVTAELKARREARAGVVSLEAERAKRR